MQIIHQNCIKYVSAYFAQQTGQKRGAKAVKSTSDHLSRHLLRGNYYSIYEARSEVRLNIYA